MRLPVDVTRRKKHTASVQQASGTFLQPLSCSCFALFSHNFAFFICENKAERRTATVCCFSGTIKFLLCELFTPSFRAVFSCCTSCGSPFLQLMSTLVLFVQVCKIKLFRRIGRATLTSAGLLDPDNRQAVLNRLTVIEVVFLLVCALLNFTPSVSVMLTLTYAPHWNLRL